MKIWQIVDRSFASFWLVYALRWVIAAFMSWQNGDEPLAVLAQTTFLMTAVLGACALLWRQTPGRHGSLVIVSLCALAAAVIFSSNAVGFPLIDRLTVRLELVLAITSLIYSSVMALRGQGNE
jgi:hypothetical protein